MSELPDQDLEKVRESLHRFYLSTQALNRWSEGDENEGIIGAKTCVDFFESRQWSPDERRRMKEMGVPDLTFNKIKPVVNLVLGYQRMNRYDIKYRPSSDGIATQEVADKLNMQVKETAEENELKWKESEMARDGIVTGRGYLEVEIDFDMNPLGAIVVDVRDPFSVFPDPDATTYDPNDWADVMTSYWMSENDIRANYGKKSSVQLAERADGGVQTEVGVDVGVYEADHPMTTFWLTDYVRGESGYRTGIYNSPFMDHVDKDKRRLRVLKRQWRDWRDQWVFVNYTTGQRRKLGWADEMNRAEAEAEVLMQDFSPADQLDMIRETVRHPKVTITSADVLLYDDWSAYRSFSIIPYFAYFRRGMTRGLVHDLIDPQKEINVRRSAEIHIISTSANSGFTYPKGSLDSEMKEKLSRFGAKPGIHIEYEVVGTSGLKPERLEPSQFPYNQGELEDRSTRDLKEISGVNDEAMGSTEKVQSGRAIEAKQRQAVVGIETMMDNMARTRWLLGRKALELFQDFYTEERFIQAEGEDGTTQQATINETYTIQDIDGTEEQVILDDVTSGEYQVVIDEAPATATFMEAQFQEALALRDKGVPIPDHILVELSTMPRKQEIVEGIQEEMAAMQAQAAAMPQPGGTLPPGPVPGAPDAGLGAVTPEEALGQPMIGPDGQPIQPTSPDALSLLMGPPGMPQG